MFDCSKDIIDFFNDEVTLSESEKGEMRKRRDANRKRLKKGLEKNEKPLPEDHVSQGSYAMHTMVRDKANDYDIDDGVIFNKDALVGAQGAEMSPLDVRKMIRDALDDGSFSKPPEVRTNCVRVYYTAGYHVDVPVYRKLDDGTLELASSEWKGSSPTDVTEWFNQAVIDKSPDDKNGRQMRRITRILKFYKQSRDSWKKSMPSGFEISVLVDECYLAGSNREDISLYETMRLIKQRLDSDLEVQHPTRDDMLTDGSDDAGTRLFREKLSEALGHLQVLFKSGCTRLDALRAWNCVFKHDYWENLIADEEESKKQKNKEEKAERLRHGNSGLAKKAGIVSAATAAGCAVMKDARAYGGKIDKAVVKKRRGLGTIS